MSEWKATVVQAGSHLTQASMAEPASKRPRFIAIRPPGRICAPAQKAHDLIPAGGCPTPTAPPPEVAAKLGKQCLVAGVDVETHDWEAHTGIKAEYGQYGFYSIMHPDGLNARIVQLGWAVGTAPNALVVKERLVQPSDFQISEKATHYHGISHDWAIRNGRPLREVLEEFITDMINVYDEGGRIVVHHLEFDCGIIERELLRAGLGRVDVWRRIARSDMCTMDPCIGAWVRMCCGEDIWPGSSKNTMCLKDMVTLIAPTSVQLLELAHTAGADAQMHVAVYCACLELAGIE